MTFVLWVCLTLCATAQSLPDRLSNEAFRQMILDFSEKGGSFQREWMSNEDSLQTVIPRLQETIKPDGVYIGVGHEQNFTYIAAVRPRIAFIVDIQRRNMIDQLVYKSLFELSTDRADFLSRLLSKKRPAGLHDASTVDALFAAYAAVSPDRDLYDRTSAEVTDRLIKTHGFELTDRDRSDMRELMTLFLNSGPTVKNNLNWGDALPPIPTYVQLMTTSDPRGQQHSYLATEENFRLVQDLQRKNLIVPIIGDFAGDKALKNVADYLKRHQTNVSVFYISNVEHSLTKPETFGQFYSNAGQLPLDGFSIFIRSTTTNSDRRLEISMPPRDTFFRSVLANIGETLERFREGKLTYKDVILMSK